MTLSEAIEIGIISVDENRELHYNGLCNECEYSQHRSYPSFSNMCMNKESEWFGCFHVDYSLQRYVDGCSSFKKVKILNGEE